MGNSTVADRRSGEFLQGLVSRDTASVSTDHVLLQFTSSGYVMAGIGASARLLKFAFEDNACRSIAEEARQGNLGKAEALGVETLLAGLENVHLRRLAVADAFLKASPENPEHPGWPAGTPDSRGGKFRPKDSTAPLNVSEKPVIEATPTQPLIEAPTTKPLIEPPPTIEGRTLYGEILPPLPDLEGTAEKIVAKILIEGATRLDYRLIFLSALKRLALNAVPLIGEMIDIETLIELGVDVYHAEQDAVAADKYINSGPHSLNDVRVSPEEQSFSSYDGFKKDRVEDFFERQYGSAGDGNQYHHIVEQSGGNGKNFSPEELQNTDNIIRLPALIHEEISAFYSKTMPGLGITVRQWVQRMPYDQQREIGIAILKMFHVIV